MGVSQRGWWLVNWTLVLSDCHVALVIHAAAQLIRFIPAATTHDGRTDGRRQRDFLDGQTLDCRRAHLHRAAAAAAAGDHVIMGFDCDETCAN